MNRARRATDWASEWVCQRQIKNAWHFFHPFYRMSEILRYCCCCHFNSKLCHTYDQIAMCSTHSLNCPSQSTANRVRGIFLHCVYVCMIVHKCVCVCVWPVYVNWLLTQCSRKFILESKWAFFSVHKSLMKCLNIIFHILHKMNAYNHAPILHRWNLTHIFQVPVRWRIIHFIFSLLLCEIIIFAVTSHGNKMSELKKISSI